MPRPYKDLRLSVAMVNDKADQNTELNLAKRRAKDLLRHARDRVSGDREPQLRPDEQLQLNCIAERLTMVGRTPGRLILTDKRLIFEPVTAQLWFPMSVQMPRDRLCVGRSGRLSQLLHLRGLDPAVAPTYLHATDIKISRGRKAAWFRVHDAEEWERALANP